MKIHIKHFYLESNLYLFLDLQYIKIMKSLKVNLIRLARDLWYFILQYYTLQCFNLERLFTCIITIYCFYFYALVFLHEK